MLVLRVDVTFEDQSPDRCVRSTQKRAEIEDGGKNARLVSRLLHEGTWPSMGLATGGCERLMIDPP